MRRPGPCAAAPARSCAASSPAASGCAESGAGTRAMRDTILYDSAFRLFGDHVSPKLLASAAAGEWPGQVWAEVERAGYLDVLGDGPAGMVEAATLPRG